MSVPLHIQQTLADLSAVIDQLQAAKRTIVTLYPEADQPAPASVARTVPCVVDVPEVARTLTRGHRRRQVRRGPRLEPMATVEPPPPDETAEEEPALRTRRGPALGGGKYDERLLSALKQEQAQFGMTSSDLCRVFTGPGKPKEVQRISGGVSIALQSLQRRGLVRKDGRHWHIVREGRRG